MLRFLLDTDHLTLFERDHVPLINRLAREPAESVGVSVVTVEESLRGRLATLARASDGPERMRRYAQLLASVQVFNDLPVAPFTQASEDRLQILLALRLRIGTKDLRIAATALGNELVVVTRNRRDFAQVPGLMLVDWSA